MEFRTHLYVPFLNLMSNLVERAGGVVIRLGGNTQEFATLVEQTPAGPGHTFDKEEQAVAQGTVSTTSLFCLGVLAMLSLMNGWR